MIKLNKLEAPEILRNQSGDWTDELMDLVANGNPIPKIVLRRYASSEIKDALRRECHEKCIYCESKVSHITFEHIEHIRPKAVDKYPELTYVWENLGLACPKCNMNKGHAYDEEIPFVNPYSEDPSEFLVAVGHFVYSFAGNRRGELTEKTIQLNRPGLVEQRKERIDALRTLADRHSREDNQALRELLSEQIEAELSADKPYSMCANSIIRIIMK